MGAEEFPFHQSTVEPSRISTWHSVVGQLHNFLIPDELYDNHVITYTKNYKYPSFSVHF